MELADLIRSIIIGEIILYTIFIMYTAFIWYITIWILNFLFKNKVQKVVVIENEKSSITWINTNDSTLSKINKAVNPFS